MSSTDRRPRVMVLGPVKKLPQVEHAPGSDHVAVDDATGRRAEPAVSSFDELATTFAHDVKNPLTVVTTNLEFLTDLVAEMTLEAQSSSDGACISLRARLCEAEIALRDTREAAARIHAVVRRMKLETLPPGKLTAFEHDRESKVESLAMPKPSTTPEIDLRFRVLIIDDQESVGRTIQRSLRDYDVTCLLSAQQALTRIMGGEHFDVILCDVMMPEMNGADFYAELTRYAPELAKRTIFMTGGTTASAKEFVATVTQPVLAKPFDPKDLRALILEFAK